MRGGSVGRFKGLGQAQTLSYIENVFPLRNSEENAFLLGCGEVVLPKTRLGQAQTLSYEETRFHVGQL